MPTPDIVLIHADRDSWFNRDLIKKSMQCGCFFCGRIYDASEVKDYVQGAAPDQNWVAICSYCRVDAVLPDALGYPVTEEFLSEMMCYHFVKSTMGDHMHDNECVEPCRTEAVV